MSQNWVQQERPAGAEILPDAQVGLRAVQPQSTKVRRRFVVLLRLLGAVLLGAFLLLLGLVLVVLGLVGWGWGLLGRWIKRLVVNPNS